MLKRAGVIVGVVGAVVLAGCGTTSDGTGNSGEEDGDRREPSAGDGPPVVNGDGEVMLRCGGSGPGFAASAMTGGVEGLADKAEVEAALEDLVNEFGIDAPPALRGVDMGDAEWIVLGKTDQDPAELVLGVGDWGADGPGVDGDYVVLDRVDNGWRASGWGDCNLEPVLPADAGWVDIVAAPDGLDPAATSVAVEVIERDCTSGRDPEQFLHEPFVVEDNDVVTVYWTSEAVRGDANCQGNPPVRQIVELDQPLGDRALLDGSTWPPEPVGGP